MAVDDPGHAEVDGLEADVDAESPVVQALWGRTATLLKERSEQERLNRDLLARIAALELWKRRHLEEVDFEDPDDEPVSSDYRLDRVDEQLKQHTEQFHLINGKLDVILDVVQNRSTS